MMVESWSVRILATWGWESFPISTKKTVADMSEVPSPQQNHLLATLSAGVQSGFFPHLELVAMELGQVLYEPGITLQHIYFPTDSIVSLLYVTESGDCGELAVVGNDGLIGIALFMGGESTPRRAVVQSAGHAYRIPEDKIRSEFNRHGEVLLLLLRYTQALITQITQTVVCNRYHSLQQQLCRWLLLSLDRLPDNSLTMTQQLIANMLSIHRDGVVDATTKLEKLGVVEYGNGMITVIDRGKLEALSCECYPVIKKETDRLLAYATSPRSCH